MTYCLGIRVKEGLVALADGRVTAGNQIAQAQKIALFGEGQNQFFTMSSGLRSVRDKVFAYFRQSDGPHRQMGQDAPFPTMLDAVSHFAQCLRSVRDEDEASLKASNLNFNLHAILGGQLPNDPHPTLFLVYPEGNWIEVGERTPYISIGSTGYGKPILDRALRYDSDLRHAMRLAYLSFDSSRTSAADIGYPVDLMSFSAKDRLWRTAHFEQDDLVAQRQWWNREIMALASRLPDDPWAEKLLVEESGSEGAFQVLEGGQS